MMRWLVLLCVMFGVAGCLEENKSDCRNDGDCRGVRVCRDGECITPPDFQNNGLPPREPDAGGSPDSGRDSGPAVDAGVAD